MPRRTSLTDLSSEFAVLANPDNEAATTADMARRITDLFRIPDRYLRSVHLERDFEDAASLKHYIVTRPIEAIFYRISEGLRPKSGRRAWRITGDYGTGKSSFALVLAHLLSDTKMPLLASIRRAIARENDSNVLATSSFHLMPILVTGSREPLVIAIARGISQAIERLSKETQQNQILEGLYSQAIAVEMSGDSSQLLDLLKGFHNYVVQSNRSGVVLILDELGKFLEYASLHPEKEDLYILQQLAEMAARSGDYPLIIMGLLHQGFHAYAERLPSASRLEWEKVAGRYEEITFDQPLAHVAALVAGALNIDIEEIPEDVASSTPYIVDAIKAIGWHGTSTNGTSLLALYPLHPTVLPVLVRFFARFGQHERSLFSFLLSSEPFGLQAFAEREATAQSWYRLPELYDYVRTVFGHQLAEASFRSSWVRIVETIDLASSSGIDSVELQILKSVALLNLLDAEHLLATDAVLAAAIADGDRNGKVSNAIASLRRLGLLFLRGSAGGYCLWPNTSINLESAFQTAQRTLGPIDQVSAQLRPYLGTRSILARRHYIETGTLRYFEVRYAELSTLEEIATEPTSADGIVVVTLCDSFEERSTVAKFLAESEDVLGQNVVVAVPPPLQDLEPELQDARCWQWVVNNTPELSQDSFAAAEVARQVANSQRILLKKLSTQFGFQGRNSDVDWWYRGNQIEFPRRGGLSHVLSTICDKVYNLAPLIHNELLNRHRLSSAAAGARMRLIERMFSVADQPALGFPKRKAPPEKSMYLSVLKAGNLHRKEKEQFILGVPPEDSDPLRLRPALLQIIVALEQKDNNRVSVPQILDELQAPPYGVRAGVAPFLLAFVAVTHAHQIAVYEHGTFLPQFDAPDFLRLIKQPAAFEFQMCHIEGIRAEVFTHLTNVLGVERSSDRNPELLDVVRPLMEFAAQLPEYTRKNSNLKKETSNVRDALLNAREPATLIFKTLPIACGFPAFSTGAQANAELAQQFVTKLRESLNDLRGTYPQLLERIRARVVNSLASGSRPDRTDIVERSSRVVLAASEPRLQAFARSLADIVLSDDAWAERVGSFVISKPPARWLTVDESRAMNEIDMLAATYCRVEATVFTDLHEESDVTAVRLVLTQSDGIEEAFVVRTRAEDEQELQDLTKKVEDALIDNEELRLAALARVLQKYLLDDRRLK